MNRHACVVQPLRAQEVNFRPAVFQLMLLLPLFFENPNQNNRCPIRQTMTASNVLRETSNLADLLGNNGGVGLLQRAAPVLLVVERAFVVGGVSVRRAEEPFASALCRSEGSIRLSPSERFERRL